MLPSFSQRFRGIRLAGDEALIDEGKGPEDPALPPLRVGEPGGMGPNTHSGAYDQDIQNIAEMLSEQMGGTPEKWMAQLLQYRQERPQEFDGYRRQARDWKRKRANDQGPLLPLEEAAGAALGGSEAGTAGLAGGMLAAGSGGGGSDPDRDNGGSDRRFGSGMMRDRGRDANGTPAPLPRLPKPGTLGADEWQRNFDRRRQDAIYAQIQQNRRDRATDAFRTAQQSYSRALYPSRQPALALDASSWDFDRRFPEVARIGHSF